MALRREANRILKDMLVEGVSRLLHPLMRTAPASPPTPGKRDNILVVKPASLGDVLMSTAFLAELRANLPQAQIAVLVTTWAKEALAANPHCDRVIDAGSVGFPGRYGWRDYRACIARVRREGFTHCFVLDRSPLMALLPRLAHVPWRAGLNSAHRGIALHVSAPCPPDRHEADIYLDVLRAAGLRVTEPRLHFRPQAADRENVRQALSRHGVTDARPLVAIHAGGGANPGQELVSKRWPSAAFAAFADRIVQARGVGVVLVGGHDDTAVSADVAQKTTAPVADLTGTLSFTELGALIESCRLFVGNDSAPMHLAAAVGTPTVALFGPTSPAQYGPYRVPSSVVRFRPGRTGEPDPAEVETAVAAAVRLLEL